MKEVVLDNILQMAREANGSINHIYLHWSAGHYNHMGPEEEHYHIAINGEGKIFVSTDDLTEKKPHTWQRNTGAVGVSMLGCFDAVAGGSLGSEPPTDAQIESMAQVIAVLAKGLDLTIDYDHVKTHAEAANEDDYGPNQTWERWDLWYLHNGDELGSGGDILRGKANFYFERL